MAITTPPQIETDDTTLTVKADEDHFTVFWPVDRFVEWNVVFSICEEESIPPDTEVILYTEERPENEFVTLEEARKRLNDESPLFLRINAEKFNLTWEYKPEDDITVIGFISDEEYGRVINDLYYYSFETPLSNGTREKLAREIRLGK